jgi:hypothetical protein
MNLSPTEFERARVVRQEILQREGLKKTRISNSLYIVMAILLVVFPSHERLSYVLNWVLPLFWFVVGVVGLLRYRELNLRYKSNLQFLETLRHREPHLYASLIAPREEHPLLEKWSHSLEKRAILWRVDRFLRGRAADR